MKKRYRTSDGEVYEISDAEVSNFMIDFPDAIEVETYTANGEDYDISSKEVSAFMTDFPSAVKKKGGTQPASGAPVGQPGQPSAPSFGQKVVTQAFTSGEPIMTKGLQKKPVEKRPYQDISYNPEAQPSETTQAVETPVIKAAKQDFKQTQLKSPVKAPVTPEGIQELEEKIKEPDKTFLKFQDYQTSIEDLEDLEGLYDEDLSTFQSKLSRRPDLYAKYSGRTEQEVIDLFNALSDDSNPYRRNEAQAQYKAESNALYENFVKDYKSLKSKHGQITSDLGVMTDKLISDVVNEKTYKNFLAKREFAVGPTNAEASFGEVISIDDVDKAATEIVDRYGLPTDGEAWRLVKNKVKGEVFNQYIKPKVNKELKKTNPELLAKRQQMFDAGFKADDDIYAKADSVLIALQSQYEQDAKAEMDLINSEYVGASDRLNQVYQLAVANIEKQQSALNDAYKNGQIDQLEYESAFTKLEDDKKLYYDEYQKNYPSYDQYVKKSNEINSRYNRKFEIQKKLITDKAQAELEAAYKKYAETYEEDPKLLEELNNAYKAAYDNVVKQQGEIMKMGASISANPLSSLYNSTMTAVGGVFKGWGGSMGSKSLELLGETMEQNFMMPAPRTEDFSDWTNLQNLSMITGNVAGSAGLSMIPTAAAAIGTAYATGGLGLPASVTMVTSGITGALAGWGAETIDTAGRSYLDVFERSGGDVARANEAAKRSVKSQYDILWSYSFEALPFIGKALKFIPTQAARAGVGAAVETATEFTQEIRQGIAEENIVEFERDPWYNFDEAINDERRRKQTLISIGPVGILGGAGQIGSKSIYQERRDAAIAQQQKSALVTALPDQRRQYIQNMVFNRNGKFANAVIASLYASGKIDEKTSADMMLEIKRAEQIKEAGKSAGLSGSKLNIYGFYSARAEEAERNAGKFAADPILSKAYEDMAKQYRDAGVDFMGGKNPDLLTLTYADGSQAIMLPEDVNALFSDPIALSLLNQGSISIEAYDKNGQGPKIIEELGQRAETYAKKNRYTEASKFSSPMQGLRQNISDRIQQLYAMRADLNERQKQQEAERIRQEETAAFEQKQMQRQQQESGERDLEIERLQQQRMALGIDDVTAFFSDMKPLVATMVERMEAGQSAPQSGIKAASDYLYSKYKELTAMKSDPNRMMTIAQIESMQAQLEQDLQTLAGNPPSQKIQVNDQENIQGLPGQVGVGQEPIQAGTIQGTGAQATQAGGVLQTQREEIEKRRQEELNSESGNITIKKEVYTGIANGGEKEGDEETFTIDTQRDGSRLVRNSDNTILERIPKENTLDNETYLNGSWGLLSPNLKETNNSPKDKRSDKINAKYDAELAALEAPQTQAAPTRISEINNLEQALFENEVQQNETGTGTMSEQQIADVTAKLDEMRSQNKEGGLNEIETLMKQALGENVITAADIDKMVDEGSVEIKCPPGTQKAEQGMRMGFIPGGKWDIVTEFKGKSHENGGIDIEIAGGKINYTSKEPNLKAKRGGFWKSLQNIGNTIKDVGLTVVDTTLGTVGNVAGIQSMQDIIDEDQYENDKFDEAGNFAGKIAGTALKVIPVTAPIAGAVGMAGGLVNQVAGIDAKNYDPSKHTSKLDQAGNIISTVGSIAGMAVNASTAANASKAFAAGDKLSAAQKMSMKMGGINKTLGQASKIAGMVGVGGGGTQQQPQQFLQQTQSNPTMLQQQTIQNPYQQPQQGMPVQQAYSNSQSNVVTINGVNYTPDQYGNLIPLT